MAVIAERMAAKIEGDFVVFLIGARINAWWKPWLWLPVVLAMRRMLKELAALPAEETGFLGVQPMGGANMVQYWRSFEHLEAYARAATREHRPAWAAFNRALGDRRDQVGIWHETYLIPAGAYEAVYSGMPPFGLGHAAGVVPATGAMSEARRRLRRDAQAEAAAGAAP